MGDRPSVVTFRGEPYRLNPVFPEGAERALAAIRGLPPTSESTDEDREKGRCLLLVLLALTLGADGLQRLTATKADSDDLITLFFERILPRYRRIV